MMTGIMWFKIGITGGFLRAGNETSGSGPYKTRNFLRS
jgi:hypothetical protein